ncbi:MAG: ABC transporter permease [Gemmatimonadaceae bacterium]
MPFLLAAASLRRHRARTLFAVLGVAVSAAMLLDMVMLGTGMRESFRDLLLTRGFQLRIAPRGTLPFDTEATIARASEIAAALREREDIIATSPVLGASVHMTTVGGDVTAFALGADPTTQGDYELLSGSDMVAPSTVVANRAFLNLSGAEPGDTIRLSAGYDPQLRTSSGSRTLRLAGIARFLYLAEGQPAVALPLATLQEMAGKEDRASLFMVRVREGVDVERTRRWIEQRIPRVKAISTATAIASVDERLSYFRQLAVILGAVSLLVAFLLVTTLVTVSVNERLGEIAVLRAIGVSKARIVIQIAIEGFAISVSGAALGLILGLATARYLSAILSRFPGLPAAIDFFLFQPSSVWTALGLLMLAGLGAGIYPAWRGASLPIAATLREEAIG